MKLLFVGLRKCELAKKGATNEMGSIEKYGSLRNIYSGTSI